MTHTMLVAQIFALIIFVAMFILIISEKIEKHYITLGCGLITLVVVFGLCMHSLSAITETLNFSSIATKAFWYTGAEGESS